jgi:beta-1,2-mannobiose phosphorylase / 1,2-beta-oligomannan phosphorylase
MKQILTTPKEMEMEPPLNFPSELSKDFRRLAEINPAIINLGNGNIEMFPRVIYCNNHGKFSMITKRKVSLEGEVIKLSPKKEEEVLFIPEEPYARFGFEDLRISTMETEEVYHAFPVVFDGLVARTEYRRTSEYDPKNFNKFECFGIIFPNIEIQDALSRVKEKSYKQYWEKEYKLEKIRNRISDLRKNGHLVEDDILLGTKDASAYPLKINGKYGVIFRLKPNIQIAYIDSWEDLAKREFWQNVISNIGEHTLLEVEDPINNWIGLGGPPFEIFGEGMIIPYHTGTMKPERTYTGDYALVDPKNPKKILGKTKNALKVTETWEQAGKMQDVPGKIVFPTGNIVYDEHIYTIYGFGDYGIASTSIKSEDLLKRIN